jgi:hypothetical protein
MTTKKILLIVGGVVIAMGLVVALFVGAIVGFALYQVGNSAAAARAKDFLRTSEKLKQDIGEVTDFGSIITGNMNMANGSGETTLNLKVIGANETVNASVHLIYVNGDDWRVSSANYVNKDGRTIDLLNPFESNNVLVPLLTA